jgi:hypothetical protein
MGKPPLRGGSRVGPPKEEFMRMRFVVAAALAAGLLAGSGPPALAGSGTSQVVRGRLVAADDAGEAWGKFALVVQTRGDRSREALAVDAWKLDAPSGEDAYHVFLVSPDGNTEADFGEARLNSRGRLLLRFRSGREDYPENGDPLADFAGGTVEVRLGADVVLGGEIPELLGITDDNGTGSGAAARAWAQVRMKHTSDGKDAKGVLWCLYANEPRGTVEALGVDALGLGEKGQEFTVVAVDAEGGETELGTMTARTRFAVAVLTISTARGDAIPGGGVLDLAGRTVEVRDAEGTVHLTATFPDLATE